MTESEWLTTRDLIRALPGTRLQPAVELRLQVESFKRVWWVLPARRLELLVTAGEEYCRGRAGKGLVELARDRVLRELAGHPVRGRSVEAAVQSLVYGLFRHPTVSYVDFCRSLVGRVVEEWLDQLPLSRGRNQYQIPSHRYFQIAHRSWEFTWRESSKRDSWAGSLNSVRLEAREHATSTAENEFILDLSCILRDLTPPLFRQVAFAQSWRTETAVALATGIYADRAFDRLPILADALEEAGCDVADVLNHCRGPGPHARGCWVVDGVLGKV